MIGDSNSCWAIALIALAFSTATPLAAQEVAPPPTPTADRLAEEMRVLARNPRDVRALLTAGELSARLNDPAAAGGFLARAQALDPANPRLQAGQAMVMLRKERPGEALRLFADAERRGLSMDAYASDRGLAYDLIGAQAHAQRDYRIAMRGNPDDETVRRYALSLGISGRTDEAMRVLDPLLRRSDRAGWRARAFILAMNGDAAGADKIAASMMGGVGTALAPFFRRLPTLTAADKAFAVHFGELRRTTARIADAQLAPPLLRLAQEPGVTVAAAELPRRVVPAPSPTPAPDISGRGPGLTSRLDAGRSAADRRRERLARELAARKTAEAEVRRAGEARAAQEREALAAKQRETERLAAEQQAAREAEARRVAEVQARERAATELAAREREAQRVAEAQQPTAPQVEPAQIPPADRSAAAAAGAPAPGFATTSPAVTAAAPSTPAENAPASTAQAVPPAPRIGGEDNVIARIIAGITIPASELGVEPMPGRQPSAVEAPVPAPMTVTPAPAPVPVEMAKAEAPKLAPAAAPPRPEAVKRNPEAAKPRPEAVKPESARAAARAKPDSKAGDPKAIAAKAAAAKGKAKPDPAKAEPARNWAQVAGGANVSDLPKTWRGLVAKAPAEFKGRQAWTTPLRFTNRLLVGPFKTPGEAQSFVNAIGKKGLSAFAWTSEAGQKIEKLAVK